MSKSHRVLLTNRSQHRSAGSDAFKPLPLVTLSGPGEGLPQVLCGPLLADDARGEPKMRIDVRVGAMEIGPEDRASKEDALKVFKNLFPGAARLFVRAVYSVGVSC